MKAYRVEKVSWQKRQVELSEGTTVPINAFPFQDRQKLCAFAEVELSQIASSKPIAKLVKLPKRNIAKDCLLIAMRGSFAILQDTNGNEYFMHKEYVGSPPQSYFRKGNLVTVQYTGGKPRNIVLKVLKVKNKALVGIVSAASGQSSRHNGANIFRLAPYQKTFALDCSNQPKSIKTLVPGQCGMFAQNKLSGKLSDPIEPVYKLVEKLSPLQHISLYSDSEFLAWFALEYMQADLQKILDHVFLDRYDSRHFLVTQIFTVLRRKRDFKTIESSFDFLMKRKEGIALEGRAIAAVCVALASNKDAMRYMELASHILGEIEWGSEATEETRVHGVDLVRQVVRYGHHLSIHDSRCGEVLVPLIDCLSAGGVKFSDDNIVELAKVVFRTKRTDLIPGLFYIVADEISHLSKIGFLLNEALKRSVNEHRKMLFAECLDRLGAFSVNDFDALEIRKNLDLCLLLVSRENGMEEMSEHITLNVAKACRTYLSTTHAPKRFNLKLRCLLFLEAVGELSNAEQVKLDAERKVLSGYFDNRFKSLTEAQVQSIRTYTETGNNEEILAAIQDLDDGSGSVAQNVVLNQLRDLRACLDAVGYLPDRRLLTMQAKFEWLMGHASDAYRLLDEAIEVSESPKNISIVECQRGHFYWSDLQYKEAEQAFAKACAKAPNHAAPNQMLGKFLLNMPGREQEGLARLNEAVALAGRRYRGAILLDLLEYFLSIENTEEAIAPLLTLLSEPDVSEKQWAVLARLLVSRREERLSSIVYAEACDAQAIQKMNNQIIRENWLVRDLGEWAIDRFCKLSQERNKSEEERSGYIRELGKALGIAARLYYFNDLGITARFYLSKLFKKILVVDAPNQHQFLFEAIVAARGYALFWVSMSFAEKVSEVIESTLKEASPTRLKKSVRKAVKLMRRPFSLDLFPMGYSSTDKVSAYDLAGNISNFIADKMFLENAEIQLDESLKRNACSYQSWVVPLEGFLNNLSQKAPLLNKILSAHKPVHVLMKWRVDGKRGQFGLDVVWDSNAYIDMEAIGSRHLLEQEIKLLNDFSIALEGLQSNYLIDFLCEEDLRFQTQSKISPDFYSDAKACFDHSFPRAVDVKNEQYFETFFKVLDREFANWSAWLFYWGEASRGYHPRGAIHVLKNGLDRLSSSFETSGIVDYDALTTLRRSISDLGYRVNLINKSLLGLWAEKTIDLKLFLTKLVDQISSRNGGELNVSLTIKDGFQISVLMALFERALANVIFNAEEHAAHSSEKTIDIKVQEAYGETGKQLILEFSNSYDPSYNKPFSTGQGIPETVSLLAHMGVSFATLESPKERRFRATISMPI